VNITLIHDIWRYILVDFFLFKDDEHFHHISGFFSFLIKIYFKK